MSLELGAESVQVCSIDCGSVTKPRQVAMQPDG
jgi:hypothetical protein